MKSNTNKVSFWTKLSATLYCSPAPDEIYSFLSSSARPLPPKNTTIDSSKTVNASEVTKESDINTSKHFTHIYSFHSLLEEEITESSPNIDPNNNRLRSDKSIKGRVIEKADIVCNIPEDVVSQSQDSRLFTLRLTIEKCNNLPAMDIVGSEGQKCDPFYRIWLERKGVIVSPVAERGVTIYETQAPVWKENNIHDFSGVDLKTDRILIKIYDEDLHGAREEEIGYCRIPLAELQQNNIMKVETTLYSLTSQRHDIVIDEKGRRTLLNLTLDWRAKFIFKNMDEEKQFWPVLKSFWKLFSQGNNSLELHDLQRVRNAGFKEDDEKEDIEKNRAVTRMIFKAMDIDADRIVSRNDFMIYVFKCVKSVRFAPLYAILNMPSPIEAKTDYERLIDVLTEALRRETLKNKDNP